MVQLKGHATGSFPHQAISRIGSESPSHAYHPHHCVNGQQQRTAQIPPLFSPSDEAIPRKKALVKGQYVFILTWHFALGGSATEEWNESWVGIFSVLISLIPKFMHHPYMGICIQTSSAHQRTHHRVSGYNMNY